jgi:regulator of sigma E protease
MVTQEMGTEVKAESPASQAGILEGDKVLSIDGKKLKDWQDLAGTIRASGGRELTFVIERKDKEDEKKVETIELKIQPIREPSDMALATGNDDKQDYVIGISPAFVEEKVDVLEAAKIGVLNTYGMVVMTLKSIKALVLGKLSPKSLGGPIAIVKGAGQSASAGVDKLFGFIMFLSVSLGVLNLLPIPVLDGGHLVFFTIGFIKRSPVSIKTQEFLTRVGMAFLLALRLFALCNDVVRLFD